MWLTQSWYPACRLSAQMWTKVGIWPLTLWPCTWPLHWSCQQLQEDIQRWIPGSDSGAALEEREAQLYICSGPKWGSNKWSVLVINEPSLFSHLSFRCSPLISSGAGDPGKRSALSSDIQPLSFCGEDEASSRSASWSWCIPESTWCRGSLLHTSGHCSWCTPECNRAHWHYFSRRTLTVESSTGVRSSMEPTVSDVLVLKSIRVKWNKLFFKNWVASHYVFDAWWIVVPLIKLQEFNLFFTWLHIPLHLSTSSSVHWWSLRKTRQINIHWST